MVEYSALYHWTVVTVFVAVQEVGFRDWGLRIYIDEVHFPTRHQVHNGQASELPACSNPHVPIPE
jgi:hypothetical protein